MDAIIKKKREKKGRYVTQTQVDLSGLTDMETNLTSCMLACRASPWSLYDSDFQPQRKETVWFKKAQVVTH